MNERREQTPEPPKKPAPWSAPRPWPRPIRTERLEMRFYEHDDAQRLLDALNVDRASPWLPWASVENRTLGECHYTIERYRRTREEAAHDDFPLGIFDAATGELVGGSGFHRIALANGQAEIGYWIRADRRERGLCTEATAALLSWGFQPQDQGGWGFRRITILVAAPNVASRRVPEKLGLRLELRAKADRWVEGFGFVDTLGWGVTIDEWDVAGRRMRAAPEGQSL